MAAVLCRRLLALLALGALPKHLDPMRRAKANREGCLCLGPIFDLAQVRSVDMYTEQRVSPAPNAERWVAEFALFQPCIPVYCQPSRTYASNSLSSSMAAETSE